MQRRSEMERDDGVGMQERETGGGCHKIRKNNSIRKTECMVKDFHFTYIRYTDND